MFLCRTFIYLFMQKRIRIGTAIIAAIVLIIGSYVGIQNIKQTSIIQTFESSLEKMDEVYSELYV